MRVLVCGGRDFTDKRLLVNWLDSLNVGLSLTGKRIEAIIEGGQRTREHGRIIGGADFFASEWARANNAYLPPFEAKWGMHGLAAGPIRNKRMIDEGKPDLVVAFPGNRGTADMVHQARAAWITVIEVTPATSEGVGGG